MAVIQTVDLGTGVQATYWKLVRSEIDMIGRRAVMYWNGYLDEAARASGLNPMTSRSETVPVSDEAIAAIYGLSLSVSQFATGTPYLLDPWRVESPGDGAIE